MRVGVEDDIESLKDTVEEISQKAKQKDQDTEVREK